MSVASALAPRDHRTLTLDLMWLCTIYGFFSVSAAKLDPSDPGSGLDPDTLMIRGRSVLHLENLQERFPDLLGKYTIATSAGTDYYCRLVVPAKVWMAVQMGLTEEIEYGNFKNEVSRVRLTESEYSGVLHDFWALHNRMQTRLRTPRRQHIFKDTLGDAWGSVTRRPAEDDPIDHWADSDEEGQSIEWGDAEPDGLWQMNALPEGAEYLLVSKVTGESLLGTEILEDVAVLTEFMPASGRKIAKEAAERGFIERIPKRKLRTMRGIAGPGSCEFDVPIYDLGYDPSLEEEVTLLETESPTAGIAVGTESKIIGATMQAESSPSEFANSPKPKPVPTPLVEDTTVVGGVSAEGAPVIRPKLADGTVSEGIRPTDPREKSNG